ncbi:DDE-type integrase/transposase/recombinase [Mameliella alba]|nr:DDE-type integrase/transposase/recombinase [Mameliella alba]MBY6167900.1 DDE-type integrase/transposase/recombinase [Mameliella alba]MBY6172921.1 DDE-type integrase/transposase/recombinase [Mameliella alba]
MTIVQKVDGRHLLKDGKIYRVIGRVPGRAAVCIELNGEKAEISLEQFHEEITLGNVSEGQMPEFDAHILDSDDKSEVAFRKRLLALVDGYQSLGMAWPEIVEATRQQLEAEGQFASRSTNMPSIRTIQNWRKRVHQNGASALVDSRSLNSGNRIPRHEPEFEEIVLDIINEQYVKSDRVTVTYVAKNARAKYIAQCAAQGRKPGPCGRKSVVAIIRKNVVHEDALKSRLGASAARPILLQARQFQSIEYAYDRIEVDSTRADIFVHFDGHQFRPWVTLAIDAATGFIVGMVVSLASPTGSSTVAALYEAMTGQDEAFFDRHGIKNRVRISGNPLTVVADQGSENGGDIVNRLLDVTHIELQKNIPGHPEKKPFVERAMGTLKNFVTQLPGATQTRQMPARTRTAKAIDEACLSFDDFVTYLQIWRFDIYGQEPRRRVQSPLRREETPTESWQRLLTQAFVPEPLSRNELVQMFFCFRVTRHLFRYGIEVGRIQYWSWDLARIQRSRGETVELEVWTNPADIRSVIVVDPDTGKPITVYCKDPEMPPLTAEERDRILASNRRDPDEFLSAYETLAALVEGLHHEPKKKRTKMAMAGEQARRAHRDEEIVQRSKTQERTAKLVDQSKQTLTVQVPSRRNKISKRG